MGGDRAPDEIVAGALEAAADGDRAHAVRRRRDRHARARARRTTDVIEMHEKPAEAVRAKPRPLARRRLPRRRRGTADAVISAGNTGAMLAAGLLELRRLPGVMRPAIAVPIPREARPVRPPRRGRKRRRAARSTCSSSRHGRRLRRGDPRAREARGAAALDRRGAGEGEPARRSRRTSCSPRATSTSAATPRAETCSTGAADVVVTDGFTGNVALKLLEGTIRDAARALRAEIDGHAARQARRPADPAGRAAAAEAARPGHLRRRLSARPARARGDRARQLVASGDRQRDPARGAGGRARRRRPARGAARPSRLARRMPRRDVASGAVLIGALAQPQTAIHE